MQIAPVNAGSVARRDRSRAVAFFMREEIANGLRRGAVASGCGKCRVLDISLPSHAAERAVIGEVLRLQGNEQGAVCVFRVAARVAHAVRTYSSGLGRRGDDLTAGAHAEGICARAVGQVNVQRIVGRGERAAALAVLREVNIPLLMLDARAHGKGLCLHGNARLFEHLECIPRRVTYCEDEF